MPLFAPSQLGLTSAINQVGTNNIPRDVRDQRKYGWEFHLQYGQPVIFKHRWTLRDVQNGLAQYCPFHDGVYGSDNTWDPYCYGTGILGGYADGVLTFVTLADTPEEALRFSPTGEVTYEKHPGMVSPWTPDMATGDLIITVLLDPNTWDILEEFDRYILEDVTSRTVRGERGGIHKIQQEANVDKLLVGDQRFEIPYVFDYGNVPQPDIPVGMDPSLFPVGSKVSFVQTTMKLRAIGLPSLSASTTVPFYLKTSGKTTMPQWQPVSLLLGTTENVQAATTVSFFLTGIGTGVQGHI